MSIKTAKEWVTILTDDEGNAWINEDGVIRGPIKAERVAAIAALIEDVWQDELPLKA